jgi:hypothetical protein
MYLTKLIFLHYLSGNPVLIWNFWPQRHRRRRRRRRSKGHLKFNAIRVHASYQVEETTLTVIKKRVLHYRKKRAKEKQQIRRNSACCFLISCHANFICFLTVWHARAKARRNKRTMGENMSEKVAPSSLLSSLFSSTRKGVRVWLLSLIAVSGTEGSFIRLT